MNLDKIEKLVKIIEESSLQEFSIQEGDIKIKMSKRAGESIAVPFAPGMGMPVAGTAAPEAAAPQISTCRKGSGAGNYPRGEGSKIIFRKISIFCFPIPFAMVQ